MISKATTELDSWSNKDFLQYYIKRLEERTGVKLNIPPIAWAGFLSRIKGFRDKLRLSASTYKDFIDKVFDNFFSKEGYTISFGAIVSEKVYNIVKKEEKKLHPFTNEDFKTLRDRIYSDKSLFNQIEEIWME
jgi:hypothetical protein